MLSAAVGCVVVAMGLLPAGAAAAGTETLKISIDSDGGTGVGVVEGFEGVGGIRCGNGATACEANFESNQLITLLAEPTERSTFTGWTGCEEIPQPKECRVRINTGAETDVDAEFSARTREKLTVSNPGSGVGGARITGTSPGAEFTPIECGNGAETCEAEYNQGAKVKLLAEPAERSTFTKWEPGECQAEFGPHHEQCEVEMTAAKSAKAVFAPIPQEALTVKATGAGSITGTSPGHEFTPINCGATCTAEYNEGATIVLTATLPNQRTHLAWTGCTSLIGPTECEVTMAAAEEVHAEFTPIPQQTLTVEVTGEGTVTGTSPGAEFTPINCGATCTAEYNEGATIVLTAGRAIHSKFAGWEGCTHVISTNEYTASECEVQMAAAETVKAKFSPIPQANLEVTIEAAGEVTSSPPGIACTSGTCTGHFDTEGPESAVTLTATPSPDNHFKEWTGLACDESSATTCEVTMTAAKSVKAVFAPNFQTLKVTPTGPGSLSASSGAISGCEEGGGTCTGPYQEGSVVTLTASPAPHNHVTWGEGECKAEPGPNKEVCEVEIEASTTEVHAAFTINRHTLTVIHPGLGSVSASSGAISACSATGGTCAGEYDEASTVTLTATPAAHHEIAWQGCTPKPSNEDECEVEIGPADQSVTAAFPPIEHMLTVTSTGEGSLRANSGAISHCTETGGTCSGTYIEAATVTLFASPPPHQAVSWSGCTSQPAEEVCEVEIPAAAAEVKATFSQVTHPLYITKAGTGSGLITCNGAPCAASYPAGTELTILATPAAGSTFAGWSGEACSGTGTCHFTIEATTALTATFTANPSPPLAEERCVVPTLAGRTLTQARTALRAAHCALGNVKRPKVRKHHKLGPLVVKSSSPQAGATSPAGSKVNLKLKPKAKKGKK